MPACCIVQCGARNDKNQPQLSFHRFPRNESVRKKWLEAIGEENINPRHKNWYICSLHFDENCFNRTLDVIRLRDNSVPTIFPASKTKEASVLCETGNIEKTDGPGMPAVLPLLQFSNQSQHEKASNREISSVLSKTGNIEKSDVPCRSAVLPLPLSNQSVHEKLIQGDKVKALKEKVVKQRLKIKRLNEKDRRRNKKIANFKDITANILQKVISKS